MGFREGLLVGAAVAMGLSLTPGTAAALERDVATNLVVPWDIAFLPDRSALVTERNSARVLSVSNGTTREVARIPGVAAEGEGGLLGIAVSPNYATDRYVFVYYTSTSDNRIARFRIGETPQPIVTGIPRGRTIHNGGGLSFGPDGLLYAGTGDAGNTANAQNPSSLAGKILRMTTDGRPAPGNPTSSLVYSLGHRNVQGLAWDTAGRMYAAELGQNRLDELNRIQAGGNYGWPTCEGSCNDPRFVNPLLTWSTATASPSGLAFHNGNLYMAALRGQRLWKIPVTANGGVGQPQALFSGTYGRLRGVASSPDGTLWFSTSNRDGRGSTRPGDDRIVSTTS
ncbi:glucose/arabinose dehydrogenase [Lentzea atacamensis]|uniref:Glucose/arabinose dehydrogenase n=1 Tax=Lentzea atacamensis TaxID=531938 RepID=A0ABX9EAE0_9PSEU|nr:PQQ-dependent sugar dehydrogenase [Lentzea atacamensis]RAS67132.1 glucose/arabinose dehydrogenase [Lentzea atacamensis]